MEHITIKQEIYDDDQVSNLKPSQHSTTSVERCNTKASGCRKRHNKTKTVKLRAVPSTQQLSIGMFLKQEEEDDSAYLNSQHHQEDEEEHVHTDQLPLNVIVEPVGFTQQDHDDNQNNDNMIDDINQGDDDDESVPDTAQPPVIRVSEGHEQLDQLKQQVSNLEMANHKLSTDLVALEAKCVQLETDNRSLVQHSGQLRESNIAIQQDNSNLTSQLESAQSQLKVVQSEVSTAKFDLELKQYEIAKMQAKLESVQKDKSVIASQLVDTNSKLINILAEKESLQTQIDTLNDQLANSVKAKQLAESKETQTESDQIEIQEAETLKTKALLTETFKGIIHEDQNFDELSTGLEKDAMNTQQDFSGPETIEETENINAGERVEIDEADDNETIQPVKRHRSSNRPTHQKMHFITVTLQCPQCDKMILPDKFNRHLKVKHSIEQFRCAVKGCSKSFDSRASLGRHRKSAHRRIVNWLCGKCPSRFSSYHLLSYHTTKQHLKGKFDCSYSGCTFTTEHKAKVINHYELQHKNAKKCGYDDCQYETMNGSHMIRHRRIHLGIKPYRCTVSNCGYSAAQRCSTMRHIQRRHLSHKPRNASQDPSKYIEVVHDWLE